MSRTGTTRRAFLGASAAVGTAWVAGCLGGSATGGPARSCRERRGAGAHEFELAWSNWRNSYSVTYDTDPNQHARGPSVALGESIVLGGDEPYRVEVENRETCRRIVVDPAPEGPPTTVEAFALSTIYEPDGALESPPVLRVTDDEDDERNPTDLDVRVEADEDTFASSGAVDRYVVRLLDADGVVAATDPTPVGIGYPAEPSVEPGADGGAEIHCNKAPGVEDDWTVSAIVETDGGEWEGIESPAGEHEGEFVLATTELAYEDVADFTLRLEQDGDTIIRFTTRGQD